MPFQNIFEMFNKLKLTLSTYFYGFKKLGFSGENTFHWKDPNQIYWRFIIYRGPNLAFCTYI